MLICCFVVSHQKYHHKTFPPHPQVLQNNCQSLVVGAVIVSYIVALLVNSFPLTFPKASTTKLLLMLIVHAFISPLASMSLNSALQSLFICQPSTPVA
jgi:hypothetical protein